MTERIERSVLVTPGSNLRMIEKAAASAADVVVIDLEDAVAPDQKAAARAQVAQALIDLDWGDRLAAFRLNALDTPWFYRDLIEIVEAAGDRIGLIVVPKVNQPEDVYVLDTLLNQIEQATGLTRPIGLEVQIETATGLANCVAIAAASSRVEAITFGPGDYAASTGMPMTAIGAPDAWDAAYAGHRFHYPMSAILIAGRAAGARVIDGPYADFRNDEGLRQSCRTARALGYDGKWAIHPAQIEIINQVFSPTAEEVLWARQIAATYEAAMAAGSGAMSVDGMMVDAATLRMARSTLARLPQAGAAR